MSAETWKLQSVFSPPLENVAKPLHHKLSVAFYFLLMSLSPGQHSVILTKNSYPAPDPTRPAPASLALRVPARAPQMQCFQIAMIYWCIREQRFLQETSVGFATYQGKQYTHAAKSFGTAVHIVANFNKMGDSCLTIFFNESHFKGNAKVSHRTQSVNHFDQLYQSKCYYSNKLWKTHVHWWLRKRTSDHNTQSFLRSLCSTGLAPSLRTETQLKHDLAVCAPWKIFCGRPWFRLGIKLEVLHQVRNQLKFSERANYCNLLLYLTSKKVIGAVKTFLKTLGEKFPVCPPLVADLYCFSQMSTLIQGVVTLLNFLW